MTSAGSDRPRLKVFNWQIGYRQGTASGGVSRPITATSHVDRLVEDASTAYMAPEAFNDDLPGEHLDIFSLGAIAYHIFSGQPPATSGLELGNKLRETKGLQISSVLNGAGKELQDLIQYSTHPEVTHRFDSVADFLAGLDLVENELTLPDRDYQDDPTRAQANDILAGGFSVIRRLGQGAFSVVLLVKRDGDDLILKVANTPEHNGRLKDEAEILGEVRHAHVVELIESVEVADRAGFLMQPVFAEKDKDKKVIETLRQRLRKEGRLHIDLLQRFGEDLLGVVCHLEEQGIPHRDIKPDNIAVGTPSFAKSLSAETSPSPVAASWSAPASTSNPSVSRTTDTKSKSSTPGSRFAHLQPTNSAVIDSCSRTGRQGSAGKQPERLSRAELETAGGLHLPPALHFELSSMR